VRHRHVFEPVVLARAAEVLLQSGVFKDSYAGYPKSLA